MLLLLATGSLDGKTHFYCCHGFKVYYGLNGISCWREELRAQLNMRQSINLPILIISGSGGGARMYEGVFSLMQMAKTCAALAKHGQAGLLHISLLTNPTMAGIMASFAGIGDVIMAEPKALIGFTGPRVIEQTIRQKLPEGFQRSEFLLAHGLD